MKGYRAVYQASVYKTTYRLKACFTGKAAGATYTLCSLYAKKASSQMYVVFFKTYLFKKLLEVGYEAVHIFLNFIFIFFKNIVSHLSNDDKEA